MKDPFEAALEEQESPPESPIAPEDDAVAVDAADADEEEADAPSQPTASVTPGASAAGGVGKGKEEEEEEEEENMDVEFGKFPSGSDPDKMVKMQAILSQFTEEQMSRYESFRRSGFQKANMRRVDFFLEFDWMTLPSLVWNDLEGWSVKWQHYQPCRSLSKYLSSSTKLLTSITGSQKISIPMTIVVSGIGKLFVGELIETARIVMTERKESGPIRPCHIREAFRRLKLEGKIPKRSVPRLFR